MVVLQKNLEASYNKCTTSVVEFTNYDSEYSDRKLISVDNDSCLLVTFDECCRCGAD